MKGVFIIFKGEISEEAKTKLKKMEEARKRKIEKLIEDYKSGKLKTRYIGQKTS